MTKNIKTFHGPFCFSLKLRLNSVGCSELDAVANQIFKLPELQYTTKGQGTFGVISMPNIRRLYVEYTSNNTAPRTSNFRNFVVVRILEKYGKIAKK